MVGGFRLGVARALLSASKAATKTMAPHLKTMVLHVRLANKEANALYTSDGWKSIAEDGVMATFSRQPAQRMMSKEVQ